MGKVSSSRKMYPSKISSHGIFPTYFIPPSTRKISPFRTLPEKMILLMYYYIIVLIFFDFKTYLHLRIFLLAETLLFPIERSADLHPPNPQNWTIFFVPRYAECSETYAKTIYRFFCIYFCLTKFSL